MNFFVKSLRDCFVERLHDFFFGGEVASYFLLKVCVILCAERSRNFCVFVCGGCVI